MEKTLSFSILKEKIIKTNELLSVLLEKNKSLDRAQKWSQHLKAKLDQSKNEIIKLKLKNETLTCNFNSTEKKYDCLRGEHDNLKKQFNQLENETSKTINNVQINYQLTNQELTEYKRKVTELENQLAEVNQNKCSPVKPKKSQVKKKKVTENQNDSVLLTRKVNELQTDKDKLISEKGDLLLQLCELKKELRNFQSIQDDYAKFNETKNQLKIKEQEVIELKNKLNSCVEEKDQEIDKLSKNIMNLEIENKKYKAENGKLKDENCSYHVEISMLQQSNFIQNNNEDIIPIDHLNAIEQYETPINETQGSNKSPPTDEEISKILEEMIIPKELSPLTALSEIDHDDDRTVSPTEDIHPNQNQETSSINLELKKIVTKRRILKKKKQLLARKKCKEINLFSALVALRKANINFVISSDSIIPSSRGSSQFLNTTRYIRPNIKNFNKNNSKIVTKELNCNLSCCHNSYMLLKECDDEDAPLLGFIGVKNEIYSREIIRGENESLNFSKLSQCHRSVTKRKKINCAGNSEKLSCTRQKVHCGPVVASDTSNLEIRQESCKRQRLQLQKEAKKCNLSEVQPPVENETDEGYSSYRRENTPPLEDISITKVAKPQVRRSKRTASIMSVIKKRKVASNRKQPVINNVALDFDQSLTDATNLSVVNSVKENSSFKAQEFAAKQPVINLKTPKTSFKRPVCSIRRSPRLVTMKEQAESTSEKLPDEIQTEQDVPLESPQSPKTDCDSVANIQPMLIPLDKSSEKIEKMPTTKIEVLFNKLILYSAEEEASNEVVRQFAFQEPHYIAEAILERVAVDYHDTPDTKYSPAPLMTDVQRTMLGFMSKLEKINVNGVFDSYLTLAEQRLLTCKVLHEFGPITRLYLAICKHQKNLTRMRKLCCDVFYFCGDFAVPFLFMVLTSWTEVLPHEADSKDMPIARVLVQIVYMKECNTPGYNLLPLRDLLIKFYGYPTERWDVNEFFKELFYGYLRNPVRSSDFPLLLYCKNRPEKWVYEKIEEHLKPIIQQEIAENFKATLIILIGNLYNRFSSKSEVNYLPSIRQWFSSLTTETTPDVVRRSVYLCLNRLKKK